MMKAWNVNTRSVVKIESLSVTKSTFYMTACRSLPSTEITVPSNRSLKIRHLSITAWGPCTAE